MNIRHPLQLDIYTAFSDIDDKSAKKHKKILGVNIIWKNIFPYTIWCFKIMNVNIFHSPEEAML